MLNSQKLHLSSSLFQASLLHSHGALKGAEGFVVHYSTYKLSSIKSNIPNTLRSIIGLFLFLASAAKHL